MIAHVNIGSNLGDSRSLLERAVAEIALRFPHSQLRRSHMVSSEPWGFTSPHKFLNIGVEFKSELTPLQLLHTLQEVEQGISSGAHRLPDGSYADRRIDIDLIYYGNHIIGSRELTLPHPRMHLRRFVLEPLAELSPEWRHPLLGLTPKEMLRLT